MTKHVIVVASEEFNVVKTGIAQAEQVLAITRWLARYGKPALAAAQDEDGQIQVNGVEGLLTILDKVLEVMTAEALVDLFGAVLGASRKFSRENFDIAVLIDAVIMVYEESPSVQRLVQRFFSTSNSENEEDSNSTQSE
jgi:hypothetical protein